MVKKTFPYAILIIFFVISIYNARKTYAFLYSKGLTSNSATLSSYDPLAIISMFFQYFSIYFIGFTFVFIGIYCYIHKPNSVVTTNFFYLMIVTGFAIAFSYSADLGLFLGEEIERGLVSFIPYFLIRFFEYFPASTKPNFFRKVKYTNLSLASIFTILYFTSILTHWNQDFISNFTRNGIIISMFLSIIVCIVIIKMHLKSNSRKIKNQLHILIGSLNLSFGPVLLFSGIPNEFFQFEVIPHYYTINMIIIFPISLAYLLIKQEIIDLDLHVKRTFYKLLSVILTTILINLAINLFVTLSFKQIIQLNLIIITSIVIFDLIQKFFKPIKIREWKEKTYKIQKEKKFIFQEMLNGNHLNTCAKYVIDLIHKIIDISGVCIIWKQEGTPKILSHSGIFNDSKKTEQVMEQILHLEKANTTMKKVGSYFVFPLSCDLNNYGCIVIGQKRNATNIDKDELALLEKIQCDALEIFSNADLLNRIEKELKKSQETSYWVDHYNTILLKASEDEKKSLSTFLHDEVLQNLILISNKLQFLLDKVEVGGLPLFLEIRNSLKNSIYEIREMCNDLHPVMVEDLGLELSLQAMKKKIQMNHNILVHIDYQVPFKIISTTTSVQTFRMIKELVNNSVKHADPFQIFIILKESNNSLIIKVEDDGKGFVVSDQSNALYKKKSLGLITIEKKVNQLNGDMTIQSELNKGTSTIIKLPMEWSEVYENQSNISR